MFTHAQDIRNAFWCSWREQHLVIELDRTGLRITTGKPKRFRGKSQNDLPATVRTEFVDFVDALARDGGISEKVAASVTL